MLFPARAVDPGAHPHYNVLLRSAHVTRVYLDAWARPRRIPMQRIIGVLLSPPPQTMEEAHALVTQVRARGNTTEAMALVNLIETILVYKLPTLSREEIQQMLDLSDTALKQTRFYQDVFLEGRLEGEVAVLLRLLQRRFGALPAAVQECLPRLSLLQLEALGEALLKFHGLVDLEHWLASREEGAPAAEPS